MLKVLKIKNFAIIDNINIEFKHGLTALTGETGAGKSIIIDAIGLLFGERSSNSMVRNGENKAIVEGEFINLSKQTILVLDELGIEQLEEDILIIKREINNAGKSLIRINGDIVTLSQLEIIAETLGDIHTQNDTKKLFLPKNYLSFIDDYDVKIVLNQYQQLRVEYLKTLANYCTLVENIKNDIKDVEYLKFQYEELKNAQLDFNEYQELNKEIIFLNNFEKIYNLLASIISSFNEHNINEHLYKITNEIDKLANFDNSYRKFSEQINNMYYELEDIRNELSMDFNNLDFDLNRQVYLNNRLNLINNLEHKYQKNIVELIAYIDDLEVKIDNIDHNESYIENEKQKCYELFKKLSSKAIELTNIRKEKALKLCYDIKNTLNELMLSNVTINIDFKEYQLDDFMNKNLFFNNGCDNIDILVSFNIGEDLKPLSKVASGGEMSRVMLALKVHLLKNINLSTIVFDEIDSGVSGIVATAVAKKMKILSQNIQVLTITHLPIVASFANNHILVKKEIVNNRTITKVIELDYSQRINELSSMISPNDLTDNAKELAKSMLENSS